VAKRPTVFAKSYAYWNRNPELRQQTRSADVDKPLEAQMDTKPALKGGFVSLEEG